MESEKICKLSEFEPTSFTREYFLYGFPWKEIPFTDEYGNKWDGDCINISEITGK